MSYDTALKAPRNGTVVPLFTTPHRDGLTWAGQATPLLVTKVFIAKRVRCFPS